MWVRINKWLCILIFGTNQKQSRTQNSRRYICGLTVTRQLSNKSHKVRLANSWPIYQHPHTCTHMYPLVPIFVFVFTTGVFWISSQCYPHGSADATGFQGTEEPSGGRVDLCEAEVLSHQRCGSWRRNKILVSDTNVQFKSELAMQELCTWLHTVLAVVFFK